MATKLIPRLQEGGLMQKYVSPIKPGSSLAEQALLKTRNANSPGMNPIQPIGLNSSQAGLATGLGNTPFANLDTKTLAGTTNTMGASTGMPAAGIGAIATGVADMGIAGIDAFSKTPGSDQFGQVKPENEGATVAKSTLKSAGTGVATGAAIGSVVPVLGTAIGAVAGGLIGAGIGFFKGKKDAAANESLYNTSYSGNYGKFYGNQYASQFAAMKGKDGMKMNTARVMSAISPSNRLESRIKPINVIVSGKLHKENNNLGNRDKGIPVIDKKGKKIFELEKEEWILNLNATKRAEELVNNYNTQGDSKALEELGKLVHKELMTNTQDNSNKFGLEV